MSPHTPCLTWPLCGYSNEPYPFEPRPSLQRHSPIGPSSDRPRWACPRSCRHPATGRASSPRKTQTHTQTHADAPLSLLERSRAQLPPCNASPGATSRLSSSSRKRKGAASQRSSRSSRWTRHTRAQNGTTLPTTPSAEMFSPARMRSPVGLRAARQRARDRARGTRRGL